MHSNSTFQFCLQLTAVGKNLWHMIGWFQQRLKSKGQATPPRDKHTLRSKTLNRSRWSCDHTHTHTHLRQDPPGTQLHNPPACGGETSSLQTQILSTHPCWLKQSVMLMRYLSSPCSLSTLIYISTVYGINGEEVQRVGKAKTQRWGG